jgi:hypothetical protein
LSFIIDLFHRGGPYMWLLLPLTFASVFLACARFGLARHTRFPGLGMAMVGMLISTGVMADATGIQQALGAVVHASPETQAVLLDAGLNVSRIPLDGGLVIAAIAAVLFGIGWARSWGASIKKGPMDSFGLALSATSFIFAIGAAGFLFSARMPLEHAISADGGMVTMLSDTAIRINLTWITIAGVLSFLCGAAGSCLALGTVAFTHVRELTYCRSINR